MGATISGLLVRDGDCIRISEASLPTPATPVWPSGYSARSAASAIEVLDPQGRVVARTGQSITLAGGYVTAAPHPNACTSGAEDSLFEINQQLVPLGG